MVCKEEDLSVSEFEWVHIEITKKLFGHVTMAAIFFLSVHEFNVSSSLVLLEEATNSVLRGQKQQLTVLTGGRFISTEDEL